MKTFYGISKTFHALIWKSNTYYILQMRECFAALAFRLKAALALCVLVPLLAVVAVPLGLIYQITLVLRCQKTKMRLRSVFEMEREVLETHCCPEVVDIIREVTRTA